MITTLQLSLQGIAFYFEKSLIKDTILDDYNLIAITEYPASKTNK